MGRLRPCPTRPAPSARPGCRPARSSFFRAGVRVVDLDLATLALADGRTGVAPGPVALPTDTRIVQDGPDRVRADVGQPIRCAPQGTLQACSTTRSPSRPARDLAGDGTRSGSVRARLGRTAPVVHHHRACGSTAASPTWLKRATHCAIESPTARPTSCAASVYELPSLTARMARARATDAAGALWASSQEAFDGVRVRGLQERLRQTGEGAGMRASAHPGDGCLQEWWSGSMEGWPGRARCPAADGSYAAGAC